MVSWAEHLTADLSSALSVDVVEERQDTRELHICVRPAESQRSELPKLDAVQGWVAKPIQPEDLHQRKDAWRSTQKHIPSKNVMMIGSANSMLQL